MTGGRMGGGSTWRRGFRGVGMVLALSAVMASGAPPSVAMAGLPGFGGGNDRNDVCAAERAPILARKKQYDDLRRSQIASAVGEGLKKGAVFFAEAMMSKYGLNLPGQSAAPAVGGGIPGFGGMGALLSGESLMAASRLQIPGVTLSPTGGALAEGVGGDTRAIAAVAVVVAIAGTVEAYVQLKAAAANGDRNRLSQSIDDDAGLQVGVSQAIDAEEKALADCRARQAADLKTHLASASNDSDRRRLSHQRSGLEGAIRQDVDLTGGVVGQQANLAKTFTQGRAMSENKSEADVLGSQAPAYADKASTTPLQLPAAAVNPSTVTQASNRSSPPPPKPSYATDKAVPVRASAGLKGKVIETLPAGTPVRLAHTPGVGVWVALDLGGGSQGYVRVSDLTRAKAPALAAPSNIREHNQAVIEARNDGPNRLKSLLTDVQARRHTGRWFAALMGMGGARG